MLVFYVVHHVLCMLLACKALLSVYRAVSRAFGEFLSCSVPRKRSSSGTKCNFILFFGQPHATPRCEREINNKKSYLNGRFNQ